MSAKASMNPPALATTTRSSRRTSAVFAAPSETNRAGRFAKNKSESVGVPKGRGRPKKCEAPAPKKFANDDSFVSGDAFDFVGMESPHGPMTRRRSSMFVGTKALKELPNKSGRRRSKLDSVMETPDLTKLKIADKNELPITSTRRRSKLPILLETPELSQIDNKENEAIIESPGKLLETPESSQLDNIENVAIIELIPSPENEISFKNTTPVIKMAPATSAQDAPAQVESGIKDTPKRVTKTNTPKSIKKSSSAKSVTTPKSSKIPNVAAKKSGVRSNPWPSKVVISPIKKAALQRAFAGQVINLKKTPPHTLKKKLNTNMKLNSPSSAFPGTPQATDPMHVLKQNLKRKIDTKMDQKVEEIPKNSSPYTLMAGETENGSPAEILVKMDQKPSKQNVTGTPAPIKRGRILRNLDQNIGGSPDPRRSVRRQTPKQPKPIVKTEKSPKTKEISTPKLEMENAAVNKVMSKVDSVPSPVKITSSQMITGDLGRMCSIM